MLLLDANYIYFITWKLGTASIWKIYQKNFLHLYITGRGQRLSMVEFVLKCKERISIEWTNEQLWIKNMKKKGRFSWKEKTIPTFGFRLEKDSNWSCLMMEYRLNSSSAPHFYFCLVCPPTFYNRLLDRLNFDWIMSWMFSREIQSSVESRMSLKSFIRLVTCL